jgi:hypothetical protein
VVKGATIMRRIIVGTGTVVLVLATMMWVTAPVSAYRGGGGGRRGGGGGGGGYAGGGRAVAHVGSIHYGARATPDPVDPAVRPGAVRSGNYAGAAARGGYRNPYRDDYFRHFRPGYRSFVIGDASYYYYDNLPVGCQTVLANGITYDLCDGVYYQPYIYGGQTVYMVVPTQ